LKGALSPYEVRAPFEGGSPVLRAGVVSLFQHNLYSGTTIINGDPYTPAGMLVEAQPTRRPRRTKAAKLYLIMDFP
jgi:hypothetical protein